MQLAKTICGLYALPALILALLTPNVGISIRIRLHRHETWSQPQCLLICFHEVKWQAQAHALSITREVDTYLQLSVRKQGWRSIFFDAVYSSLSHATEKLEFYLMTDAIKICSSPWSKFNPVGSRCLLVVRRMERPRHAAPTIPPWTHTRSKLASTLLSWRGKVDGYPVVLHLPLVDKQGV
jgi:hypothetical protein